VGRRTEARLRCPRGLGLVVEVGQEPVTTLETQVTNQDGVVVVNGTAVAWRDP